MRTHEFIRAMKNRLGCQEAEAIQDWLEFAGDIADGTETDYERELDDIMRALSYVRNNFSPDVLQKSVRFPTLANEIIYGAALFASGMEEKQRLNCLNVCRETNGIYLCDFEEFEELAK